MRTSRNKRILKETAVCGMIMLAGYVIFFCLLQAPALWYTPRPDPSRSLLPGIFGPINALFPQRWVTLEPTQNLALLMVPLYMAAMVLVTGPLLYLLRRLRGHLLIAARERRALLVVVAGFTVAFMLVLLFVRGVLSTDVYSYVWYSRIWVDHGASPYTHAPIEFVPPDPEGSLAWVYWQKEPSVYGPVWVAASAVAYKVGQMLGGFSAQVLTMRLLADAAHLANAWLVWNIAGVLARPATRQGDRLKIRRTRPANRYFQRLRHVTYRKARANAPMGTEHAGTSVQVAALLLYIWNPLLLIEFAGSGHNDAVMLTLVLLALWLHLKGSWRGAALALGLAVLVKLPAAIFIPGYVWYLLWQH
ncbi:MAG TPA: hypothetical protein VM409_01515, partial [Chloroflexia bacterium]|nr:hypothetical protein [Chloroflexia bacterium]